MSAVSSGASAVVDRAMEDEAFLSSLRSDPESAIEEYDLPPEEEEAIIAGDDRRLSGLIRADDSEPIAVVVVVL